MSVYKTADEKRDAAKEHLRAAYDNLLEFLKEDTWGHDDYNAEYVTKVHEVALELLKLRNKL